MKYHLIGINGAGMSALAGILEGFGHSVSGSDLKITGHKKENILGADRVIFTPAVTESSPGWVELQAAKEEGIEALRYDQLLGEITRESQLIAITGMHGKSTTTAIVARIFESAGLDPTVLVGAQLPEWNNLNYRIGRKDLWVLEADDYEKKFLTLNPTITVVTNIDFEHLDTYKNIEEAIETFAKLFNQTKGKIIANKDDLNVREAVKMANVQDRVVWFGKDSETFNFDILPLLKIIGDHNKLNTLAAIATADTFGIKINTAEEVASSFQGISRRQEYIGEKNEVSVFDDYAHHPTELQATLRAFREEYPDRRIVVAFQPHQHKRTSVLFNDFVESFSNADLVLLLDVFSVPGRETSVFVDSRDLAEAVEGQGVKVMYTGSLEETSKKLADILKQGDVFLTIGATDITQVGRRWIEEE